MCALEADGAAGEAGELFDLVAMVDLSYSTSVEVTRPLTEALVMGDRGAFDLEEYAVSGQSTNTLAVARKRAGQGGELEEILDAATTLDQRRIHRSAETEGWLAAIPSCLNSTALSSTEFRDNLVLRFGFPPTGLPKLCDGCREPFTITHDMACKKGGLVHQ